MRELGEIISGCVLLCGMFGLLAIFLVVVFHETWRGWKIWRSKRHAVMMSIMAAIAIIVDGSKRPTAIIEWDEFFLHGTHDIDTNDLRRISFSWDVAPGVPNVATATFSAIDIHTPSSELFNIATVPMTNRNLVAYMPTDSTNYMFWAECSFIPDAPIVTNGVYHISCVGGTNVWIPVGLKIYGDGISISPPMTEEQVRETMRFYESLENDNRQESEI